MKKISDNFTPIFFEPNKVFRVYKGGKLFGDFFGGSFEDSHYPEEWVASSVTAKNKDSAPGRKDGVSKISQTDIYWDEFVKENKENLFGPGKDFDVLIKILDSAVRLPIQAHPDRDFSRKYFNSEHGKTESWIILATREGAKIHLGFKDKISKEEFHKAYKDSKNNPDIDMGDLLNEMPVKKGDVYFIPPMAIHAIGYGCLILEVQEPTDFTVQPEHFCGDYELSDFEKFLGLDEDIAFDCFDYSSHGIDSIKHLRKEPSPINITHNITKEELITPNDTSCFKVNRYNVNNDLLKLPQGPAVYIVTDGEGLLKVDNFERHVKMGDYFFLPFVVRDAAIYCESSLSIVECLS